MRTRLPIILLLLSVAVGAAAIDEIHVAGSCELTIKQCSDSTGLISCGRNSAVDFRRADNAVFISVPVESMPHSRQSIILYADPTVRLVEVSGRAVLNADSLVSSESLSVVAAGGAKINVSSVSAANVNVSLTGSGSITVEKHLLASTLNFSLTGSGTIRSDSVTASRMTVMQRGSGKIILSGSAHDCSAVVRGTGVVDVRNLVANHIDLKLFGSGHIFYPSGVRVSIEGNQQNIIQVKPYHPL